MNASTPRAMPRALDAVLTRVDQHRAHVARAYAAATVLFTLAALLLLWRAYHLHDVLRAALGVTLIGVALGLAYESHALRVGGSSPSDPTIAQVVDRALRRHPHTGLLVLVAIMALAGALVVHFTSLQAYHPWVLGVAVGAYVAGAAAATASAARGRGPLVD